MTDIDKRFANFRACCDDAPAGMYEWSREIREIIGRHVDEIRKEVMATGLMPCNSDGAHHVEATVYHWIRSAPFSPHEFAAAEGFGAAVNDPETRERVIAQAAGDKAALDRIKADASKST